MDDALLDERSLSKLRWRCRRGLLENDLFLQRFFDRYGERLTVSQARGLAELMELADNDLLDLLLGRRAEAGVPLGEESRKVLVMLRERSSPGVGH
jgi:antitoxin CptB